MRVMPNPCPTIDSSVLRSTAERRMVSVGQHHKAAR
jgi:hypothetical protein